MRGAAMTGRRYNAYVTLREDRMRAQVKAIAVAAAASSACALEYEAVELGAFSAAGINAFGQVVGAN